MKRFVLVISLLFLFSAVGLAAPLTDFSQGKASIDLNWRMSSDLEYEGATLDSASSNFDGGLTVGLGNKFAFQWQTQNAKSKTYSGSITNGVDVLAGSLSSKLTANQFNILYSLDKKVAGFIGYTQAKNEWDLSGTFNGSAFSGTASGKTINGWQVGITGSFPLGDNLSGYGALGFGNKIENIELGLAYQLSKNAEINLFYKSTKYKDLEFEAATGKYDLKVNGPGIGVTFKF